MISRSNSFLSGLVCCLLPLLLTACFSKPATYTGVRFPPTNTVDICFQKSDVPKSCQGFAHLITSTAGPTTGRDIQEALIKEAKAKGADLILLGMAREQTGKKEDAFHFDYFGPQYPYPFPQGWMGWKFGFEKWEKAGSLIGFGLDNWGNVDSRYDSSLMIQAAFLRCQ